jgi:hypothetical protein
MALLVLLPSPATDPHQPCVAMCQIEIRVVAKFRDRKYSRNLVLMTRNFVDHPN